MEFLAFIGFWTVICLLFKFGCWFKEALDKEKAEYKRLKALQGK
jgi:hypothetical protein